MLLCGDPEFDLPHSFQRQVPSAFEFFRDQPILRIRSVELPLRTLRDITGCFQVELQGLQYFVLAANFFLAGLDSGFYRRRLHGLEHFSPDRFVHRDATERNTTRLAVVEPPTIARAGRFRQPIGPSLRPPPQSRAIPAGAVALAWRIAAFDSPGCELPGKPTIVESKESLCGSDVGAGSCHSSSTSPSALQDLPACSRSMRANSFTVFSFTSLDNTGLGSGIWNKLS
jgi:hypothetical protein